MYFLFLLPQELIAYGVSNVIGSLFSSYCAAGSISRSGFQASVGGKTQVCVFCISILINAPADAFSVYATHNLYCKHVYLPIIYDWVFDLEFYVNLNRLY